MNLWVIVPAYNERARLPGTLAALAGQSDTDFTLVVVDNRSTDDTRALATAAAHGSAVKTFVIDEPDKGVGCAVDTGFRFAIDHGATHLARTDADALPRRDWVAQARAGFDPGFGTRSGGRTGAAPGAEMVCGRLLARRDEHGPAARVAFRLMVRTAALFGRYRPANRGPQYLAPYQMHAGNNMAITAGLYLRCGGMPRRPAPTDRTFLNRARRHTDRIVQQPRMIAENSMRRIVSYGPVGTARWYLDRGPGGRDADPR